MSRRVVTPRERFAVLLIKLLFVGFCTMVILSLRQGHDHSARGVSVPMAILGCTFVALHRYMGRSIYRAESAVLARKNKRPEWRISESSYQALYLFVGCVFLVTAAGILVLV